MIMLFTDKIICPSLLSWGCILTNKSNINMLFYLPGFCAVQQTWNYTVSGLYFTVTASEAWVFTSRGKVHMYVSFFAALVKYVDPSYPELEFQVRKSAWYKPKKVNTKSKQWVPDIYKKCLPADLCSQMWEMVNVSSNLCFYEVRCTKSLLETSVADFYMHQPFLKKSVTTKCDSQPYKNDNSFTFT